MLGAIMQIALEPAAGVVSGGDDPGARRGQLRPAVGVGDRGRDEFREVSQARLSLERYRLGLRGHDEGHCGCRQ
ncbi:hypothetical protein [Dactylosporangium cerinum]